MPVDRPPQPMTLAPDLELNLIQMPFVARKWPATAQLEGVGRPEFGALLSDRLIGDRHAPLGHELFNIAQAQRETEIEPDSVGNDIGRVAMSAVQRGVD